MGEEWRQGVLVKAVGTAPMLRRGQTLDLEGEGTGLPGGTACGV